MGKRIVPNIIKLVYSKVEFLPSYVERQLEKEISDEIKSLLLEKFSDVLVCEVTPSKYTVNEGLNESTDGVLGLIRYAQFFWVLDYSWLDNVLAQGKKPCGLIERPQVAPNEPDNVLFFLTERFLWLYNDAIDASIFLHMINNCAVFEFFTNSSVIQRAGVKIDLQHRINSRKSSVATESNLKRKSETTIVPDVDEPKEKVSRTDDENVKKTPFVLKGFKLNHALQRLNMFHARNLQEKFLAYPLHEIPPNRIGCEKIMKIMFQGVPECVLSVTKRDDFLKIVTDFLVNFQCFKMKNFLQKYCFFPHSGVNEPTGALLARYTAHSRVFAFLRAYCYKIIPLEIFGSVTNRNVFLMSLKRICSAGMKDNLRLDWFLSNIKTKQISWLDRSLDISVQMAQLSCVIRFYLEFVVEVLKSCFYITESTTSNYYPFYYRKPIYRKIIQEQLNYLQINGNLEKLNGTRLNDYKERGKWYGPGSLRFIPKDMDLRPIISVSKNTLKHSAEKDMYWMMNATRSHFEYLEKISRKSNGTSYGSTLEIYKPFKEFILQIKKEKFTKIFAVKLDIKDCFGSINQDTLLEMVENLHREMKVGDLKMRKYSTISLKSDDLFVTHTNGVGKASDSFKDTIEVLHPYSAQKVYCDWNELGNFSRKDVLNYVEVFVKHCVVKVESQHYHLCQGIPQGGLLSSSLCNLFLAEVERVALKDFVTGKSDFSARFTDDILFLSTSEDKAVEYYKRMSQTCKKMGTKISESKTFLNFEINDLDIHSPYSKSNMLNWLGLTVNLNDASVKTMYPENTFKDVEYAMTLDTDQKGNRMKKKLMFMALHQWSLLILDTEINGRKIVIENIFEKCLLFASRFDCLVKLGPKNMRMKLPSFLLGVIDGISDNIILRIKLYKKKFDLRFSIDYKTVSWICYQAFKLKLSKRASLYKPLIDLMKRKIASKRKIMGQKQICRVQKVIKGKAYLNYIRKMI